MPDFGVGNQGVTNSFATIRQNFPCGKLGRTVRLACLIHAASVHPEPGSNSQLNVQNFQVISEENLATISDYQKSFAGLNFLTFLGQPKKFQLVPLINFYVRGFFGFNKHSIVKDRSVFSSKFRAYLFYSAKGECQPR